MCTAKLVEIERRRITRTTISKIDLVLYETFSLITHIARRHTRDNVAEIISRAKFDEADRMLILGDEGRSNWGQVGVSGRKLLPKSTFLFPCITKCEKNDTMEKSERY